MKYAYTIGKVKGIEIQLHITFILLVLGILVWVAITDLPLVLPSLIFLIMLFGTVLLHELSHSIVSLREGVKVDSGVDVMVAVGATVAVGGGVAVNVGDGVTVKAGGGVRVGGALVAARRYDRGARVASPAARGRALRRAEALAKAG